MGKRAARSAREVAVFIFFAAAAIAFTWPLARTMPTGVSDPGDPILNAWILDWDLHSFAHDPLHLYQAPMYAPSALSLAYSENLVGIAVLMIPFRILGLAPLTIYNVAMLLGFTLSGYGISVLARSLGRSLFASLVAGLLYAFCQFKFDHLAHLQIISSGWIPLLFAALIHFWRVPTRRSSFLLGAAFVMNGLTNVHWLLFGSFTLVMTIVLFAIADPAKERRFWLRLGAALVVGGLILLPFLIPYRIVASKYQMTRSFGETELGSAHWMDWLQSTDRSLLYGTLSDSGQSERVLFPGVMPIALSLAALLLTPPALRRVASDHHLGHRGPLLRILDSSAIVLAIGALLGLIASPVVEWKWRNLVLLRIDNGVTFLFPLLALLVIRATIRLPNAFGGAEGRSLRDAIADSRFTREEWAVLLWIAIGFIGAFGLHSFLHGFLFRHVTVFRSIRVPARWAIIAYAGLAVFSALGIDAILRGRSGWRKVVPAVLLFGLACADVAPRIRWTQLVVKPPAVARWLASERPRGPILELPMSGDWMPFPYVLTSITHHVPMINGTSGFEPPFNRELREMDEKNEFNDVMLAMLEKARCELIVLHADRLPINDRPLLGWIGNNMKRGRMVLLGRFDEGVKGAYVFALPSIGDDWKRLHLPPQRDAAGFTPTASLSRLWYGQPTFSTSTTFQIDAPMHDATVVGSLTVRGWALSPKGITSIDVVMQSAKYRFRARAVARPDVTAARPWYPRVSRPGFVVTLPHRPKGMPRKTDFQLVVTDGNGGVTRSEDQMIDWN